MSEGCRNCYAEQMAARFCDEGMPYHGLATRTESGPRWTGTVKMIGNHLDDPLRWRRPRKVFVNSMSDLFHEGLSNEQIAAIFGIMAAAQRHTFQVLTKRSVRMRKWFVWAKTISEIHERSIVETCRFYAGHRCSHRALKEPVDVPWPLPNVWLGVSAENQAAADERVPDLLQCPATVRWVSVEPQIGPVSLGKFDGLDWLVCGGESGSNARPFHLEWAHNLVEECDGNDSVAMFVKQMGSKPVSYDGESMALEHRSGANPSEWPEDLRVRQWPTGES